MTGFMEEFMLAMSRVFPKLLVQFEVREVAFLLLVFFIHSV
jgi:hypothetical protein